MIEAVNSTIANAALVRNVAEQASSARLQSGSAAQERKEISAPSAPYVSPYIKVDTQFDTAVLQIRDSDTGDVIDQYPREQTLAARQRDEVLRDVDARRAERGAAEARERAASQSVNSSQRSEVLSTSNSTFVAQSSAADSAPSISNAQLATAAFASGALSGASSSQGVSVTV